MQRKQRQRVRLALAICCTVFMTIFGYIFLTREPLAWKSKYEEAGLLRVMQYIEQERDLDGHVRDAFVDRIWRNVKDELLSSLFVKIKSESAESYRSPAGDVVGVDVDKVFRREYKDIVDFVFSENKREVGGSDTATHNSKLSKLLPNSGNNVGTNDEKSNDKNRITAKKDLDFSQFLSRPIINNFEFIYRYDKSSVCAIHNTRVLLAVPSAPGNFKRRHFVRNSKMAIFAETNSPARVKLLFFLGTPDSVSKDANNFGKLQDEIDHEQSQFGDIVQASFTDSYKNITKKAAMIMDWSGRFCSIAKFVIRTDDDVKANISEMISAMEVQSATLDNFILGSLKKGWSVHRRWSSKYFVSFEESPYRLQPPFLLGGAMGYPIRTAGLLLEAMKRVTLIWLDDVFVTGICASRVGVPIFNSSAFQFNHIEDL